MRQAFKTIGGRSFKRDAHYGSKSKAQTEAKYIRKNGHSVRVIKEKVDGHTKYSVYWDPKTPPKNWDPKKGPVKRSPPKRKGKFTEINRRSFNGKQYYLGPTNDSKDFCNKHAEKLRARGWKARVVEIPKSMRTWQKEHGYRANKYAVYWIDPMIKPQKRAHHIN